MPSWCTLYKGLITLVIFLIAIEYFFGTIIETRRWESVFMFNNSRVFKIDKNIEQIHSPLLKTITKRFNKTLEKNEDLRNATVKFSITNTTQPLPTTTGNSTGAAAPNFGVIFEIPASNDPQEQQEIVEHKVSNTTELPACPDTPPDLRALIKVLKSEAPTIVQLEHRFSWLKLGGHWQPEFCRVPKKVALIIPYRCRAEHLLLFLQHMHPFLKKQQLDYTMYIIEQDGEGAFNRASLMNIGAMEALKIDNYDCFIFHDIDLLPEDERNLYTCPEQPRHMSVAVDVFQYKLPYREIFGGVSAISREHFKLLNGFSNSFWGWGGEDDDMSNRITHHNLHISRYPISIARYTMLTHKKEKANPNRYEILKEGKQKFDTDGLSNLQYTVKQIKKNLLYTWLLVEVGPRS